jgi:anthranilate/para-aminobenzoate synthase component I
MLIRDAVSREEVADACGEPYGFWLDSALAHGELGRTSLFGRRPFLVLRAKGRDVRVEGDGTALRLEASPFDVLRKLLKEQPLPTEGGVVGYFGYELNQHIEKLPRARQDDLISTITPLLLRRDQALRFWINGTSN